MSPSWSTSASSMIIWISLSVRASPINFMINPSSRLLGKSIDLQRKLNSVALYLDSVFRRTSKIWYFYAMWLVWKAHLSMNPFPSPSKTRKASLISSSAFSSFTCKWWEARTKASPWFPSLSETLGSQCYPSHPYPPESSPSYNGFNPLWHRNKAKQSDS